MIVILKFNNCTIGYSSSCDKMLVPRLPLAEPGPELSEVGGSPGEVRIPLLLASLEELTLLSSVAAVSGPQGCLDECCY